MEIQLDVRDQATKAVSVLFARQMPYVTMLALNETAKDFQKAQRQRLSDVFTLRRKQWAEQSVKIKPFATKTKQEARISIDPPGGRGDILGKFERDTVKLPVRGSLAVPTADVPRTGAGIIREGWRPRQLGVSYTSRLGKAREGKGGTFMVRRAGGRGTIFRRVGDEIRALYQLVSRVPIKPALAFERTARDTIAKRWAVNFSAAFQRAMRTAR